MKKIIVILLLVSAFYSCERDDICAESTPTTPHLIIRFYDFAEQSETLNVVGLRIVALDNEDNELEEYQSATTTDSIAIPLRIIDNDDNPLNGVTTKFILDKDFGAVDDNGTPDDDTDDIDLNNKDTIVISYKPKDVYVSRACGYKTIFEDLQITREEDDNNWIVTYQLVNEPLTVENETEAHIKIFH